VKISRTVWCGGKGGDNLKALPITILKALPITITIKNNTDYAYDERKQIELAVFSEN